MSTIIPRVTRNFYKILLIIIITPINSKEYFASLLSIFTFSHVSPFSIAIMYSCNYYLSYLSHRRPTQWRNFVSFISANERYYSHRQYNCRYRIAYTKPLIFLYNKWQHSLKFIEYDHKIEYKVRSKSCLERYF